MRMTSDERGGLAVDTPNGASQREKLIADEYPAHPYVNRHQYLHTSAQTPYHESEQRELPDLLFRPTYNQSSSDSSSSRPYPGHDPAIAVSRMLPRSRPSHSDFVTRAPSVSGPRPPDHVRQAPPGTAITPENDRFHHEPIPNPLPPTQPSLSVLTNDGPLPAHAMSYPLERAPPPTTPAPLQLIPVSGATPQAQPVPTSQDIMISTESGNYPMQSIANSVPPDGYAARGSTFNGPVVTSVPAKRRPNRAQQACDQCRQRKARCDEGRPACGFCAEAEITCVYREVPPPKQDRTLLQILEKMEEMQAKVQTQMGDVRADVQALSQVVYGSYAAHDANNPPLADTSRPQRSSGEHGVPASADVKMEGMDGSPKTKAQLQESAKAAARTTLQLGEVTGEYGELGIPVDHDTAAHKLLRWPSIKKLVSAVTRDERYVVNGEENRGTIRYYGRGVCAEEIDGLSLHTETADDGSILSDVRVNVDYSPHLDAAIGNGSWPAANPRQWGLSERSGGVNSDGSLKLDRPTMMRLFHSWVDNMYVMHPFINHKRMERMVSEFSIAHGQPSEEVMAAPALRGGPATNGPEWRGIHYSHPSTGKRKRSTVPMHDGRSPTEPGRIDFPPPPTFPRSISSALVLLVAALGKIAEHKEFLPAFPTEADIGDDRSTKSRSGHSFDSYHVSPATSISSHSSSFTQVMLRPHSPATSSPYQSPGSTGGPLNVDVMPGLAYYTVATEILGTYLGANRLCHVQGYLMAGLYAGQLARVMESWKWIFNAAISVQRLIVPQHIDHLDAEQKGLTLIAFWTSLQLESDILAELDLPASGVSKFQDTMPPPSFPLGVLTDQQVGFYYAAQLALRKILNHVHKLLYKSAPGSGGSGQVRWSVKPGILADQLEHWRALLPDTLRWHNDDPPPREINAARLRAKYWGARYIIHRPFLHHVIHPPIRPRSTMTPPAVPVSQSATSGSANPSGATGGSSGWKANEPIAPPTDMVSDTIPPDEQDAYVQMACRNCVEAAVRSTQAFHGIPEHHRPIVTNIFGTAHAQFGNLLVLSVAARTPQLADLVPINTFEAILRRTIHFLKMQGRISPTLRQDSEILERSLLPPKSQSVSFSSSIEDNQY